MMQWSDFFNTFEFKSLLHWMRDEMRKEKHLEELPSTTVTTFPLYSILKALG